MKTISQMTIIFTIKEKNGPRVAFFADSMITIPEQAGVRIERLAVPFRPENYPELNGIRQARLENKVSRLCENLYLLWAGRVSDAREFSRRIINNAISTQISPTVFGLCSATDGNSYIIVDARNKKNTTTIHRNCHVEQRAEDIEFIYAGYREIKDISLYFNEDLEHWKPYKYHDNLIAHVMARVAKLVSLEAVDTEFDYLCSGGWYRAFISCENGIRQLRFNVNHWLMDKDENISLARVIFPIYTKVGDFVLVFRGNCLYQPNCIYSPIDYSSFNESKHFRHEMKINEIFLQKYEFTINIYHCETGMWRSYLSDQQFPEFPENYCDGFGEKKIPIPNSLRDEFESVTRDFRASLKM